MRRLAMGWAGDKTGPPQWQQKPAASPYGRGRLQNRCASPPNARRGVAGTRASGLSAEQHVVEEDHQRRATDGDNHFDDEAAHATAAAEAGQGRDIADDEP